MFSNNQWYTSALVCTQNSIKNFLLSDFITQSNTILTINIYFIWTLCKTSTDELTLKHMDMKLCKFHLKMHQFQTHTHSHYRNTCVNLSLKDKTLSKMITIKHWRNMDFTFIYILSNIWYSVLKYIKDEQSKTNTYTHRYSQTYKINMKRKIWWQLMANLNSFFNYYLKMYITYIHNW